jgi:hypothetical protein
VYPAVRTTAGSFACLLIESRIHDLLTVAKICALEPCEGIGKFLTRKQWARRTKGEAMETCAPCSVSGTMRDSAPPCERTHPLYPRGPRSGPGYGVPVHHHLVGPIRPTRRHIPMSLSGG